jgi:hypothetical protein
MFDLPTEMGKGLAESAQRCCLTSIRLSIVVIRLSMLDNDVIMVVSFCSRVTVVASMSAPSPVPSSVRRLLAGCAEELISESDFLSSSRGPFGVAGEPTASDPLAAAAEASCCRRRGAIGDNTTGRKAV